MKGAPMIIRAYGLIATVLTALLVLPMTAHSFPFDPKKGDLEAEEPGKKKKGKLPAALIVVQVKGMRFRGTCEGKFNGRLPIVSFLKKSMSWLRPWRAARRTPRACRCRQVRCASARSRAGL